MRARIRQKFYSEWPGHIRRRLTALTLREQSGMRIVVRDRRRTPTFVLFEGKNPVAWALVEWDGYDRVYNIMLYVRRDKRRLGYGKQLYTEAKKWVKVTGETHYVYPDAENYRFFQEMGEKV